MLAIAALSACGDDAAGGRGHGGTTGTGGSGVQGAADGGGFGNPSGIVSQGDAGPMMTSQVCDPACAKDEQCSHGVCIAHADCKDDEDCQNDTYCEVGTGCIPYGAPPDMKQFDEMCGIVPPPGQFSPKVKCEFSAPPMGDKFPDHRDVQSTPLVVNFGDPATGSIPSILALFTATVAAGYTENMGVLRVLRGDDCSLEANLGGGEGGYAGFLLSSAPAATGDLDGDGVADIVALAADHALVAFSRKGGVWNMLWKSPILPKNGTWAGPSIHDLDDNDDPEVVMEATVVNGQTGAIVGNAPPNYASYSQGLNAVLANMDDDANIELTNGARIWEWSAGAWVTETYYPGTATPPAGFAAVADFGDFGAAPAKATSPEIVTVAGGAIAIYAIDGTAALASTAIPGLGGGAPTIADYDGDGLAEVGVAGEAFYTVFDIDCVAARPGGGACAPGGNACDDGMGGKAACPAGILWSRATQDLSSNITGSSVFDFEGDGKSEVIYGDECFVRIYGGTDGEVLFSQYRSSCTWYENPIVADTDANFRADLVTPSNFACATGGAGIPCTKNVEAGGIDQQFPGVRCMEHADCASGTCDMGFCRCTDTAQCCTKADAAMCTEEGWSCAAPPAGTPGTGNTCRAAHPHGIQGIRVYADAKDLWVRSRTIWNQHAYAVTHVEDDGTIPRASSWKNNWEQPELNNFRQNVPGTPDTQGQPDLTAGPSSFMCAGATATLTVPICNRGSDPVGLGIAVAFYHLGKKVCGAKTTKPLNPGECEELSCDWKDAPADSSKKVDLEVVVDDTNERLECKEDNNRGTIQGTFCVPQ